MINCVVVFNNSLFSCSLNCNIKSFTCTWNYLKYIDNRSLSERCVSDGTGRGTEARCRKACPACDTGTYTRCQYATTWLCCFPFLPLQRWTIIFSFLLLFILLHFIQTWYIYIYYARSNKNKIQNANVIQQTVHNCVAPHVHVLVFRNSFCYCNKW